MATDSRNLCEPTADERLFALPAKQQRSQRSLARVLSGAEAVLRQDGLEGFSIAGVSAKSGVSVGGIYARVKGKQELLQLIKGHMVGRISTANERAIDRGQTTIDAILEDFIDSLIDGFSQDERLHRSLFSAVVEDATLHVLGERNRRENLAVLARRLVATEPRLKTCSEGAIDFGTDMIAALVVAPLTRPGSDVIAWEPLRANLKFAAKAYFQRLLDEIDPAARGMASDMSPAGAMVAETNPQLQ